MRMGTSFFYELKHALGIHQKIDQRLVHVEDNMPVAIAAEDDAAHESHEVEKFALDFGRWALRCVRAHQ